VAGGCATGNAVGMCSKLGYTSRGRVLFPSSKNHRLDYLSNDGFLSESVFGCTIIINLKIGSEFLPAAKTAYGRPASSGFISAFAGKRPKAADFPSRFHLFSSKLLIIRDWLIAWAKL